MPRIPRMKIEDQPTVYHIISRTALPGLPIGDVEKDFLVDQIKNFSEISFVEIMGYCIMGNHFHLLVKMNPGDIYSDKEVVRRFKMFYGEEQDVYEGQIPFFRNKWSNLSEFIKDIKQSFSRFYNKRHDRKGFFWGDRFKSVIVENGETLVNCLAYIDLNPLRAGIVEKPEDYRWSSIGYHVQANNKGGFLSLDFGLKGCGSLNDAERFIKYREFLYEVGALKREKGASIDEEILENERKKGYKVSKVERFKYRTRYFTDSGIIGSKKFVSENYQKFKDYFQTKKEKKPFQINGLKEIYSMKTLSECPC